MRPRLNILIVLPVILLPALYGTLPLKNVWRAGEKEREENINEQAKRNCPIASCVQPWHTPYRQGVQYVSFNSISLCRKVQRVRHYLPRDLRDR